MSRIISLHSRGMGEISNALLGDVWIEEFFQLWEDVVSITSAIESSEEEDEIA
jgi:hypothetical protein